MFDALTERIGCSSLEGLNLEIFPKVVHRGGHVRMACSYDLGSSPLCYVKWYRGNFEFYRFTPSENPPHKLFPYPGIHVNVAQSNGSQVVLEGLGLGLSGKVTCEVTTDTVIPETTSLSSQLLVLDLPESGPHMFLERPVDAYSTGETLRANCTSPPSKPAPILSFFVNGNPCWKEGTCDRRVIPVSDSLHASTAFLTLKLEATHFKNGVLNIKCTAVIKGYYKEETQVNIPSSLEEHNVIMIGSLNTRHRGATSRINSTLWAWIVCACALLYLR